jgi:hypothetical protein
MQTNRPQNDLNDICVFAPQYSSATLVSLRFHFRNNRFRDEFQNCYYFVVLLFKKIAEVWNCVTRNCVSRGASVSIRIKILHKKILPKSGWLWPVLEFNLLYFLQRSWRIKILHMLHKLRLSIHCFTFLFGGLILCENISCVKISVPDNTYAVWGGVTFGTLRFCYR